MIEIAPALRVESLIEALPFIQQYRGATFVIKYGGSAMEDPHQVERLLRDVVFLEAVGINPVLVHGGGKAITAKMEEAGLPAKFANGLRVTDEKSIRLVEETLDGVVNPMIVRIIEQFGGQAVGFSGKKIFQARKLSVQILPSGQEVDVGHVGEAERMHIEDVRHEVRQERVPVISPIGADASGRILNINADLAAAALAGSLRATKLIYVSDVPGILRAPEDPESLIPSVTARQIEELITEHVISGGMIPKVRSAAEALAKGVEKVHFIAGSLPHGLLLEVFTTAGVGTEILP